MRFNSYFVFFFFFLLHQSLFYLNDDIILYVCDYVILARFEVACNKGLLIICDSIESFCLL